MGAGAGALSHDDQLNLFKDLQDCLTEHHRASPSHQSNADEKEPEYEDDDEEDKAEDVDEAEEGCMPTKQPENLSALIQKVDDVLKRHALYEEMKRSACFCSIIDIEFNTNKAYESGKTPIILDLSPDQKYTTFASYQPDHVLFDAKSMILMARNNTVLSALEELRRHLVGAMQTGKTLTLRLGDTVPDFVGVFNDSHAGFDTNGRKSAYFPLAALCAGGSLLRDQTLAETIDSLAEVGHAVNNNEDDDGNSGTPRSPRSPPRRLPPPTWAEKLYRDSDMLPHKNFAVCLQSFRVALISTLPMFQATNFLFGEEGHGLPDKDWFRFICIVDDEEEEKAHAQTED